MSLPDPPIHIADPAIPLGEGGGVIRTEPADFEVEELAAYEPCGEGRFHYLWIEKEGISGPRLARLLADRLGCGRGDVRMAGMKDRHAITRQWVSVPTAAAGSLDAISGPDGDGGCLTLLKASLHTNALKTGHLHGNRFRIRVRDRDPALDDHARECLEAIAAAGFPNSFGWQRFSRGSTVQMGLDAMAGRRMRDKRMLRLGVSAVQSWVFNTWLAARCADGSIRSALAGDWLRKRDSGGAFRCDDPETDAARIDAGELVVTGPLPGAKGRRAGEAAARFEEEAIAAAGLDDRSFGAVKRVAPGARRDALAFPQQVSTTRDEKGLVFAFALPAGCYATVLLAQLCGGQVAEADRTPVGGLVERP